MQGLGAILAFVAGGWLFRTSPAAPFLLASSVLLAATLLLLARIREPAQPEVSERPPNLRASLATVIRNRDHSALVLLGSIFCAWLAISSNRIFFSRYAISALHLEPKMAGRLMGLFALAMLVGSMPAGLLGARLGRRRMMQAGLLLGTGAMAANTWFTPLRCSVSPRPWADCPSPSSW